MTESRAQTFGFISVDFHAIEPRHLRGLVQDAWEADLPAEQKKASGQTLPMWAHSVTISDEVRA